MVPLILRNAALKRRVSKEVGPAPRPASSRAALARFWHGATTMSPLRVTPYYHRLSVPFAAIAFAISPAWPSAPAIPRR